MKGRSPERGVRAAELLRRRAGSHLGLLVARVFEGQDELSVNEVMDGISGLCRDEVYGRVVEDLMISAGLTPSGRGYVKGDHSAPQEK